jgi:hypothetical protein
MGRNLGMAFGSDAEWVVFWDADNLPPEGFAGNIETALSRHDIGLVGVFVTGWTPRDCRDSWGVDTNSLWSKKAITSVGGWKRTLVEDWQLGWRMQDAGWLVGVLPGPPVVRRSHKLQRTHEDNTEDKLWAARNFGIITLIRGEERYAAAWLEAISSHELPPWCGLTIMLGGEPDWQKRFADRVWQALHGRIERINFFSHDRANIAPAWDAQTRGARHSRVATLYDYALSHTPENWVLTWEDDIAPRSPDLLRRMQGRMIPSLPIGCISPVYEERYRPGYACLSFDERAWIGGVTVEDALSGGFRRVGFVPAGFTLWRKSDICDRHAVTGWDASCCVAAKRRGAFPFVYPEQVDHDIQMPEGSLLPSETAPSNLPRLTVARPIPPMRK